jgi:hypothetical protein
MQPVDAGDIRERLDPVQRRTWDRLWRLLLADPPTDAELRAAMTQPEQDEPEQPTATAG